MENQQKIRFVLTSGDILLPDSVAVEAVIGKDELWIPWMDGPATKTVTRDYVVELPKLFEIQAIQAYFDTEGPYLCRRFKWFRPPTASGQYTITALITYFAGPVRNCEITWTTVPG